VGGGAGRLVQDSRFLKPKATSGATNCDGIGKTMRHEISASPFVSIAIAILPSE
jgi:hypothetical protein